MSDDWKKNAITSKKSNAIDQPEISKKSKKHKKTGERLFDEESEWKEQVKKHQKEQFENESGFEMLCKILSGYKKSTMREVYIKCGYDHVKAMSVLVDMDEDQPSQSFPPEPFQKSIHSPTQEANQLLNDLYDQDHLDMNRTEFEELFEEIAEMIQASQQEKGTLFEMNDLVEECNSIKNTLKVGFLEEFSGFEEDIQIDEENPLYAKTQQFMEALIKQQNKQDKMRQEDFPLLGHHNGNSIIHKIQQDYKLEKNKKYEDTYFVASKNTMPQFARAKYSEHTIFNVDNRLKSESDLKGLHKQFADVPIEDLKFIYKTFALDFNISMQFLNKHYPRKLHRVHEIKPITHPTKKLRTLISKETIDQELKHYSYEELRAQIDHLYKLKQAFNLARGKIQSSKQKDQLAWISNKNEPLIRKLSTASRLKLIELTARANPLYVDLHGYREEQVQLLMNGLIEMIREEFTKGNQKVKARKKNGRHQAILAVVTGKGSHSRGGNSILKPAIIHWCDRNAIGYISNQACIEVMVTLNA